MNTLFDITDLDDCDQVTREMIESTRKAMGASTAGFAQSLGWSTRKYQRLLETAGAEDVIGRDMALAIYGLAQLTGREPPPDIGLIASRDDVPELFERLAGSGDTWTAKIAPPLMRLMLQKAKNRSTATYGELAERLEDMGLTHKVWPRTVYGHPLGLICDVCMEIGAVGGERVPLLTALVVAQSGEPGPGIDAMVRKYLKRHEGADHREAWKVFKASRPLGVRRLQEEIFAFGHWDEVASRAGLP